MADAGVLDFAPRLRIADIVHRMAHRVAEQDPVRMAASGGNDEAGRVGERERPARDLIKRLVDRDILEVARPLPANAVRLGQHLVVHLRRLFRRD